MLEIIFRLRELTISILRTSGKIWRISEKILPCNLKTMTLRICSMMWLREALKIKKGWKNILSFRWQTEVLEKSIPLMKLWTWSKRKEASDQVVMPKLLIIRSMKCLLWTSKKPEIMIKWTNTWRNSRKKILTLLSKLMNQNQTLNPTAQMMMLCMSRCLMKMTQKILLTQLLQKTMTLSTLKNGTIWLRGRLKKWRT